MWPLELFPGVRSVLQSSISLTNLAGTWRQPPVGSRHAPISLQLQPSKIDVDTAPHVPTPTQPDYADSPVATWTNARYCSDSWTQPTWAENDGRTFPRA